MTTKRAMHDYTDRHGDQLDVTRVTPTAASSPNTEPGITFGVTTRHGYRVAAFLPDAEALSLLLVMAEELGIDVKAVAR